MITPQLTFCTLEEFYVRSENIRRIYGKLNANGKYIYKYYIYSRRQIKERICDIIWEYVNASDDEFSEVCEKLEMEVSRHGGFDI